MSTHSVVGESGDGSTISMEFNNEVTFPANLPYPIDYVENFDGNFWLIHFISGNNNPASFNINLEGQATEVLSAKFCTMHSCDETTVASTTAGSTTAGTTVPTTTGGTTDAPVTTSNSDAECYLLSGYTYEVYEKWSTGEQIKVTTHFETDITSPMALRDESFLKITFQDELDAELQAYWPLEQQSVKVKILYLYISLKTRDAHFSSINFHPINGILFPIYDR